MLKLKSETLKDKKSESFGATTFERDSCSISNNGVVMYENFLKNFYHQNPSECEN